MLLAQTSAHPLPIPCCRPHAMRECDSNRAGVRLRLQYNTGKGAPGRAVTRGPDCASATRTGPHLPAPGPPRPHAASCLAPRLPHASKHASSSQQDHLSATRTAQGRPCRSASPPNTWPGSGRGYQVWQHANKRPHDGVGWCSSCVAHCRRVWEGRGSANTVADNPSTPPPVRC